MFQGFVLLTVGGSICRILNYDDGGDMESIIFINHVYLVLSTNSFQEIKDNLFLNSQFSNIEHKHLKSGSGLEWEGIYIRGKNTFIELFYPQGDVQFSKKGNSGIGLGTDKTGEIELVCKQLKSVIPDIKKDTLTRTIDKKEHTWFTYITQKDSFIAPHLSLWLMEYDQAYCGSPDVTRQTYNEPYYHSEKFFKDILGLTIAIDVSSQPNVVNLLGNSGYLCSEITDNHYNCKSHDFTIDIIPETSEIIGIQSINLALTMPVKNQTHKLGETTLTLKNTKGIWDFK